MYFSGRLSLLALSTDSHPPQLDAGALSKMASGAAQIAFPRRALTRNVSLAPLEDAHRPRRISPKRPFGDGRCYDRFRPIADIRRVPTIRACNRHPTLTR